jgi:3-hydroxyisobutyrate dehydrogenase-like beta-hydroxyacid dehydrogenase
MAKATETIGFIGLGSMGLPMARNLIEAGFPVKIFNRTKNKAEELVALGADLVDSLQEVANPDGIAITMVANDTALKEIVLGNKGIGSVLARGGVHLSMSTVSPEVARELAQFHNERGAAYVASPVSGRPDAAANKQLLMWVSGDLRAQERVAPIIAALGRGNFALGEDPIAGHAAKIAANVMVINTIELLAEIFVFIEKNGIDPKIFADAITQSIFAAPIFKSYSNLLLTGDLPEPGFKVELALKDMNLALNASEAVKVSLPIASLLRERLLITSARGKGDLDVTAIQELIRELAGLHPKINNKQ